MTRRQYHTLQGIAYGCLIMGVSATAIQGWPIMIAGLFSGLTLLLVLKIFG